MKYCDKVVGMITVLVQGCVDNMMMMDDSRHDFKNA